MSESSDATLKRFEHALASQAAARYDLTLFVSGASALSARAIEHARALCEQHLRGRYHLAVVDLHEDPASGATHRVLSAPTLVKHHPLPEQMFVGDLSNVERVLSAFELHPEVSRAPGSSGSEASNEPVHEPTNLADALVRMAEAEDTLRAIGAGEIDAFVVSDRGLGRRVFTLSTADRPYRMFVENMRDGAATLGSDGLLLYANQRLADLLACSRREIVGSPLDRFVANGAAIGLSDLRQAGDGGVTFELNLLARNGSVVPVLVGISPLEVDGEHLSCVTFTDLSAQKAQDREITRLSRAQGERMAELQHAQAALTEQATHDSLTGLPNRVLVVDRIDQALARARRSARVTAVFFVDLDRFKQVNDTRGHAAGDAVLRAVAEQLIAVLRPMDTVARIGGDEFVVLAPEIEGLQQAVAMGQRLVESLQQQERPADVEAISASIGISLSVGGRGSAEALLIEADMAMYRAKTLGGARAEVFDEALGRLVQQRAVAQRVLQTALDERRILAYYQPVIDLATGSLAGFEALARMTERDGSIVLPFTFIPVAEEGGLVVPLGARVLAMACQAAAAWSPAGPSAGGMTVAVNVSARQFVSGDLPKLVMDSLAVSGLDPACLHLELTETAIIDLQPDIIEQLRRICDLGVQIGLDDFGTGYASLTHLRRLPLSFVKIDQSFVQGIETNEGDDRIVAAVIDLAANLRLRSIAEGVETAPQLERLRVLGCDQAQGYLFARPLPPADVTAALARTVW